jgi:photosystem II stability/assembly factor-like uncharacterized protein
MKLYIGTDEGLAVFEGQEEEWRPRYVRLEEHQITAVATAGRVLWAGTPAGLWRSLDGGPTWWPSITGKHPCHVRSMVAYKGAAVTTLVGAEPAAVYVSRDNGESWNEAPDVKRLRDEHEWSLPYSEAAGCIRDFAIVRNRIYAAAEVGGVLRSDDAGETWRLLGGGIDKDVHEVVGNQIYPDLLYAATGGGRFRSRSAGEEWEIVGDGYTRSIWVDPDRPVTILAGPARYVGAMGRVERSTNGGDSWALASDGFDIPMNNMVERFVGVGSHVMAAMSDGDLFIAKRGVWMWRRLDLGLAPVRALAACED